MATFPIILLIKGRFAGYTVIPSGPYQGLLSHLAAPPFLSSGNNFPSRLAYFLPLLHLTSEITIFAPLSDGILLSFPVVILPPLNWHISSVLSITTLWVRRSVRFLASSIMTPGTGPRPAPLYLRTGGNWSILTPASTVLFYHMVYRAISHKANRWANQSYQPLGEILPFSTDKLIKFVDMNSLFLSFIFVHFCTQNIL